MVRLYGVVMSICLFGTACASTPPSAPASAAPALSEAERLEQEALFHDDIILICDSLKRFDDIQAIGERLVRTDLYIDANLRSARAKMLWAFESFDSSGRFSALYMSAAEAGLSQCLYVDTVSSWLASGVCGDFIPNFTPNPADAARQDALFKADMEMICASVKLPQVISASPGMHRTALAKYIYGELKSERARALYNIQAYLEPSHCIASFQEAMVDAGRAECDFVELFSVPSSATSEEPVPLMRNMEAIAAAISKRRDNLRICFERVLQSNHALEGQVVVMFLIESSGMVSAAHVSETTLADDAVEACVLNEFRLMRFSNSARRTTVRYPISFSS